MANVLEYEDESGDALILERSTNPKRVALLGVKVRDWDEDPVWVYVSWRHAWRLIGALLWAMVYRPKS